VALLQESNTFLAGRTTLEHFRADLLATGPAVRPHANLSPAMVAATDALIAYRTNPHVDQRARGCSWRRACTRRSRRMAKCVATFSA